MKHSDRRCFVVRIHCFDRNEKRTRNVRCQNQRFDGAKKIKKPLIERRRRERINDSLCQLKSLVLEAMNRDESCYSKMEKADILDMTVTHLKNIHRHSVSSSSETSFVAMTSSRKDSMRKYLLGFNECVTEAVKYLSTIEELADDVVASLMTHVLGYLGSFQQKVKTAGGLSEDGLSAEVDKNHGLQLASPVHPRLPVRGSTANRNIIYEVNRSNNSTISFLSTTSDAMDTCQVCENSLKTGEGEGGRRRRRRGGGGVTSESTGNPEFRRFNASTFPDDSRFCHSSASPSPSSSDSCQMQNLQVRNSASENRPQLRNALTLVAKQRQSVSSTRLLSPVLPATSTPAVIRGEASGLERTVKREVLLPSFLWRPW